MIEKKWVPIVNFNGRLEDVSLAEWIGQAIGAASVCWENPGGAGIFDSAEAARIAESLHGHIQEVIDGVIKETTRATKPGSMEQLEKALAAVRDAYRELKQDVFATAAYGAHNEKPWMGSATGRMSMSEVQTFRPVDRIMGPFPIQETKPTSILVDHVPYRGSNVEAWLKRYRDQFAEKGGDGTRRPMTSPEWGVINDLLDDYREHSDTGTSLSQRVVGPHGEEG